MGCAPAELGSSGRDPDSHDSRARRPALDSLSCCRLPHHILEHACIQQVKLLHLSVPTARSSLSPSGSHSLAMPSLSCPVLLIRSTELHVG